MSTSTLAIYVSCAAMSETEIEVAGHAVPTT